jgi:hypothetical protein
MISRLELECFATYASEKSLDKKDITKHILAKPIQKKIIFFALMFLIDVIKPTTRAIIKLKCPSSPIIYFLE